MMECYFMYMLVQIYDFLKGLQRNTMLITKIGLLISILISCIWGFGELGKLKGVYYECLKLYVVVKKMMVSLRDDMGVSNFAK